MTLNENKIKIPSGLIRRMAKNNKVKLSYKAVNILQDFFTSKLEEVINQSNEFAKANKRKVVLDRDVKMALKNKYGYEG